MTQPRITGLLRFAPALALAAAAVVFATTSTARAVAQDGADARSEKAQEEEHGELHESMETIQRSMKALRKIMTKPEAKEEAIKLCRTMEAASLTGFVNMPEAPEALEGEELMAFQVDFRKRMLDVASQLLDLEVAIQKEDEAAIKALYRSLGQTKKDGHNIYIK